MSKSIYFLIVVFSIILSQSSCIKEQIFSEIPEIEFISIRVGQDTLGKDVTTTIIFSYKDGDGDLGYSYETTDVADISLTKFRKINSQFIEITIDSVPPLEPNTIQSPLNFRLPEGITPTTKNKQVQGIIEITDNFARDIFYLKDDTIKYSLVLKDRAKHFSNSIETTEVVIRF